MIFVDIPPRPRRLIGLLDVDLNFAIADDADAMPIPEEESLRSEHFRDLRWSLRSLALAGLDQPSLFPDRNLNANELAVDYDRHASLIRETYASELSDAQIEALAVIERKLETMSRDGAEFDLDLWTDAAVRTSEHWVEVRRLAAAALDAFEWTVDYPREQGTISS